MTEEKIAHELNLASSAQSNEFNLKDSTLVSLQIDVTGNSVGTFDIRGANFDEDSNYATIDTIDVSGADSYNWDRTWGFKYLKLFWTPTSGTGVANIFAVGKG